LLFWDASGWWWWNICPILLGCRHGGFRRGLQVKGEAALYPDDALGTGGLVLSFILNSGRSAEFTSGGVNFGGTVYFLVNSSPVVRSSFAANTYAVNVTDAYVNFLGFRATGSLTIGIVNGLFRISIPSYSPNPI